MSNAKRLLSMDTKQLLSIVALIVAAILLVFLVIIMVAGTGWIPDSVSGSPGDDTQLSTPSDSTSTPPGSDSLPTNLIEANRTTINPNDEATVRVGLNSSTGSYDSIRMTLSLQNSEIADIKNVRGAGAGNFRFVEQQEQSVTFEVNQINSAGNSLARLSVEGRSVGSTEVIAQVHTLTGGNDTASNLTFSEGNVTVEPYRPDVTVQRLSITHTDQPRVERQVTVSRATLPEGGFVVLYERTADGSIGDEIGHSTYLEPGVQTNTPITLDRLIRDDREVMVRLQYDKNDNQRWDGNQTDTKLPSSDRNATTDYTTLSVRFTTRVNVTLANVTDGVQKYRIELAARSNQTLVSEVTPNRITGANFAVIGGGPGSQHVEVQGVDIDNRIEGSSEDLTLFTVEFEDENQLDRDQFSVQPRDLEDDNGNQISPENVTTRLSCHSPFDEPVVDRPQYRNPTDPDCDGLFEDVDGDGRLTSNDVQALALVNDTNLSDEQIDALDFNGNGTLEFADVTRLKNETQQNSDVSSSSLVSGDDLPQKVTYTVVERD